MTMTDFLNSLPPRLRELTEDALGKCYRLAYSDGQMAANFGQALNHDVDAYRQGYLDGLEAVKWRDEHLSNSREEYQEIA